MNEKVLEKRCIDVFESFLATRPLLAVDLPHAVHARLTSVHAVHARLTCVHELN
jgi:hypothetical protein